MAYLSRAFWQQPDERLQQPLGAGGVPGVDASGGAGGAGSPAVGSATTGAPPDTSGQGAPGALRQFFAQNKDQGAALLGGLVDPIKQRMASEQSRIVGATPTLAAPTQADQMTGRGPWGAAFASRVNSGIVDPYNSQQQAAFDKQADPQRERSAGEVAGIQPIGQDVKLLGQGQEGLQTLLAQRAGANPYSGGQSRLDAWLAGSAANQNPAAIQSAEQGWSGLSKAAATPYNEGPAAPVQVPPRVKNWKWSR